MTNPPRGKDKAAGSGRQFLQGQLLIATPSMSDPRFQRAVLAVCAHDAHHAMAVIVNKPLSDVELGEVLEQLQIDPREGVGGDPVHFGGPVRTDLGLVLHTLDYRLKETREITAGVGITATREILEDIGGRSPQRHPPARFFLAIGYAGWGSGQLEEEIAMNAWAHCDADEEIIFSDDPPQIWTKAFERLGVTGAMLSPEWFAARPDDAQLN